MVLVVAVWMWGGVGCRRAPSRIAAPEWEPETMASSAIEQLDTDGDGLDDVLIGARGSDAWTDPGRAYVVLGRSTW